ncbi:hypothetical protein Xcel_0549 [Xylanimonas cellulosilytica DSM 15894]|uniref:Uncharacterized protein n=1 Tax=Xylanimonas cellulosilytica (strain DSM 15894 / JCM 12276 / CECT 5975 / KCTC 9989 / LMG 20990 / NBRC 107835 / XIL07) TaxID=446471 RepID=D1BW85_XYLCX|nr:hypothetical protein [Xylanimonas cellulosilytica]ACZ29588.1 hypothetical protein Xcel_0549 [Xylanimonas cellulosilytica DSM 15894]
MSDVCEACGRPSTRIRLDRECVPLCPECWLAADVWTPESTVTVIAFEPATPPPPDPDWAYLVIGAPGSGTRGHQVGDRVTVIGLTPDDVTVTTAVVVDGKHTPATMEVRGQ